MLLRWVVPDAIRYRLPTNDVSVFLYGFNVHESRYFTVCTRRFSQYVVSHNLHPYPHEFSCEYHPYDKTTIGVQTSTIAADIQISFTLIPY
jgi:hypothetical protein